MANTYDDTNRGVAWKNRNRSEKAPAFKGNGNFKGMEFEIAVWMRKTKAGDDMLTMTFSELQQPGQKRSKEGPNNEDGLPF